MSFKTNAMALLLGSLMMSGCVSNSIKTNGVLASYQSMKTSKGIFTSSMSRTDSGALKASQSASVYPVTYYTLSKKQDLSEEQLQLVANAASRALCNEMARNFKMVEPGEPADLIVVAAITDIGETDVVASGVSLIGSTAASVLSPVSIPLKRLPLGMGHLALEAEVTNSNGREVAALVWSARTNPFQSTPRVARNGDAYDLTTKFAQSLNKTVKQRKRLEINMQAILDAIPTKADVNYSLTGKAKSKACERYGKGPGLKGDLLAKIGAPPSWADNGPR